jgi:formylglycine-generating enzyme required for sulfatase activity
MSAGFPAVVAAALASVCPMGMAEIGGAFCVDRYEASLLALDGGEESPWPHYAVPEPGRLYKAVSAAGRPPQGHVSGVQAAAACAQAGKRLCTAAEWRRACRGPENRDWPYGPKRERGACNDDGKDALRRLFQSPRYDHVEMNDPRLLQLPDTVVPSGSRPACRTTEGVYDMVGNLHEWVAGVPGRKGRFNGGFFLDVVQHAPGCRYRTTAHGFGYRDYSTGFRCCRDLAPAP